MSFCELCGRQVVEGKRAVIIDGTIFNVCIPCSKRGKPYIASGTAKKPKPAKKSPSSKINLTDETVLNPNFPAIIREGRTKQGLTHEQMGMRMNEKASMLKKIETGALKPDEILAKKLERTLGIKLYMNVEDD